MRRSWIPRSSNARTFAASRSSRPSLLPHPFSPKFLHSTLSLVVPSARAQGEVRSSMSSSHPSGSLSAKASAPVRRLGVRGGCKRLRSESNWSSEVIEALAKRRYWAGAVRQGETRASLASWGWEGLRWDRISWITSAGKSSRRAIGRRAFGLQGSIYQYRDLSGAEDGRRVGVLRI